jgi:UDP-3-O-[3-hydroxymyristoyl] glucosamine N-acyltransferase
MIGPNVVIGKDVQLGERSIIYANTVVETSSTIGEDCIIYSNVTIGYSTQIGNRVTIKSGSVIGGEGYGFAQDSNRKSHRIPQTGIVVIEDDVVIGANNCVDRATYFETRIGRGTKFDNLCHVAHNVKIGEDCLLTAGFIVAGSTTIGNRLIASGQTGILDHLTIVDDVVLVHKPGLSEDILEKGIYAGMPIQPLQSYLKNAAIVRKLTDLRSKVLELEKKLK